ncbi:MAG: hypothetical protein HY513_05605 [Candidatus Aenigmarchaeota archaeon]|nr:hypothetical protein [Candidatus Aenigmarchaeota archaeon]
MLTLEFMGWTVAKLVVLAITLFAVWKGISGIVAPDLNNAVLTAEIIRGSINDICTGLDTTSIEGIRLTQPKPTKFYGLWTIIPSFQIQSSGDPNYLIYYESFPAGEAAGWDIYTGLQYRVITPFDYKKFNSNKLQAPGDTIKNPADVENFIKSLKQHVADVGEEFKSKAEESDIQLTSANIFVTNIVLSDSLNTFPDQEPKKTALGEEGEGNLGKWEVTEIPSEPGKSGNKDKINNRFKLANVVVEQNSLERSLIKYRSCGDNAICLKTRDAIYKFPLTSACKNIKRIELLYQLGPQEKDEDADLAVLSYKSSDFYLASPCKIPGTIDVERFSCGGGDDPNNVCKREISHPIYSYTGGDKPVVTYEGDHYKCVENIGTDIHDINNDDSLSPSGGECIRIKITEKKPKDYCWTVEPYKEFAWWSSGISAQFDALILRLHPVKFSTAFLKDSNSIVLYPGRKGEEGFFSFIKKFGERFWWGWPGRVTD